MLVAAILPAAILGAKLAAVMVAAGAGEVGFARILRENIGRAGFNGRGVEIGQDGVLLNLALAQGGEVVGDGFFFVESDLAGVGADETFVEDAAGKLVEVFVL